MRILAPASVVVLCVAVGCSNGQAALKPAEAPDGSSHDRPGTLSVTKFQVSGWRDETFHYLPALSVSAPSTGRPVFVERVDFTTDTSGGSRLLRGVRYAPAQRIQPGATGDLVAAAGAERTQIASPLALGSIAATVFFTADDGQTGIVSARATAPDISGPAPRADAGPSGRRGEPPREPRVRRTSRLIQ